MSGRSIGMMFGFGSGLRVGGSTTLGIPASELGLTFVPAHINAAGKKISHRCEIPVYCNSNRGGNGEGKKSIFDLVVWGELARMCALTCSPGKALDVLVEISSYDGRVFQNRVAMQNPDGSVMKRRKISMTVLRICFGEEGEKLIQNEIAATWRPKYWNDPASPDFQLWKNELNRRLSMQYTGGDRFGWARVVQPQGQILTPEQLAASRTYSPVAAATPETTVANAFAGQPVAPTAAPPAANPFGGATPVVGATPTPTAPATMGGFGM